MKKNMFLVFLAVASVLLLVQGTSFAINDVCSVCHTMHNSQDNATMVTNSDGSHTNNDFLLRSDCIGCHSSTTAAAVTSGFNAPVVWHTVTPNISTGDANTKTLAGGDFYWVENGSDAKGHNVADITGLLADVAIGRTPPGWDNGATTGLTIDSRTLQVAAGAASWGTNQLTCSGTYGCHGARDKAGFGGVQGAHHKNKTNSVISSAPGTIGGSYRFLGGIMGQEDTDWQGTLSSTDHNEYYGIDDTSVREMTDTTYANNHTISFLCAECHGKFHAQIDGDATLGSPWRRHPTDIALPNKTEYAAYSGANAYSVEAPVARPSITGSVSSAVTPDTDIVMCLSCHRAHGSANNDLLRWDYATMVAGNGSANTGCFTCHTTKNDAP